MFYENTLKLTTIRYDVLIRLIMIYDNTDLIIKKTSARPCHDMGSQPSGLDAGRHLWSVNSRNKTMLAT